MTTTPRLSKSLTQVNTTDGGAVQNDGQIVSLNDGGYVVVWTDSSGTYNPAGAAVIGQRYDSSGNKVGGELGLAELGGGDQFAPAVTRLDNGNIAVAFVDLRGGDRDIYVACSSSSLGLQRPFDVIDLSANQTFDPSITALPAAATPSPIPSAPGPTSISSGASSAPTLWWARSSISIIRPISEASPSSQRCLTATSWRSIRTRLAAV